MKNEKLLQNQEKILKNPLANHIYPSSKEKTSEDNKDKDQVVRQ